MNTQPHRTAVVLGASIAGLLTARALSDSFEEVLLIERAELRDDPAPRPTVPQGRHSHGLLAGGIDSLERLLPGLVAELGARGCQSGDNLRDVSWIFGGTRLAVGDSGVPGLAVARPLLEHAIRTRVLGLRGVRIRTGGRAVGLVVSAGRVTGVRIVASDAAEDTGECRPGGRRDGPELDAAAVPRTGWLHGTARRGSRAGDQLRIADLHSYERSRRLRRGRPRHLVAGGAARRDGLRHRGRRVDRLAIRLRIRPATARHRGLSGLCAIARRRPISRGCSKRPSLSTNPRR